jgi:uncharacterized protein YdcH (DUF465 family)
MADAQLPPEDLKDVLLQRDDSFRRLVLEHHDLDDEIQRLSSLTYLSAQQQYEEIALKKRKLALKDRIEAIMRGWHQADGPPLRPQ